jgi:hypothetical protein
MKKLSMPTTISVVILGAAATGCGTPVPPNPGDGGNPDGGFCPPGCFSPKENDGGPLRSEDGGIECFC